MITLIKSGCGPATGSSTWHLFASQNHFSMQTKCGSDLLIEQILVVPVKEYNGSNHVRVCKFCLALCE